MDTREEIPASAPGTGSGAGLGTKNGAGSESRRGNAVAAAGGGIIAGRAIRLGTGTGTIEIEVEIRRGREMGRLQARARWAERTLGIRGVGTMPIKETLAMAGTLAAGTRRSLVAARRSFVATRRTSSARLSPMTRRTRRIPTPKRTRLGERRKNPTETKRMHREKTTASTSSLALTNKVSSTAETYPAEGGATVETETTDLMRLRTATEETGEAMLVGATTTTGPGRPATGNQQTAIIEERKTTAERPATSQVTKMPEVEAVAAAVAATAKNSRNGVWVWDETAAPALRGRGDFQSSEREESEARRRTPEATARGGMLVPERMVQEVVPVRGPCREAGQGIDTGAKMATAAVASQKGRKSSISMTVETERRGNHGDEWTEIPG